MQPNNPIRVLIAHDDPIACAGLSATFSKYPDIEVVSVAETHGPGAAGGRRRPDRAADVVVADYENGFKLAAMGSRDSGADGPLKIMIVVPAAREYEIRSALERGVRGYVLAGCGLEELACGVRAVHRGARHLSAPVAQRLAESMSGEPLTGREQEVLQLVVEGLGNKLIARRLGIAVGTVKSHLKGAFDKLGVDSRTQAICAVERRGLLRGELPTGQRAVDSAGVDSGALRHRRPALDRGTEPQLATSLSNPEPRSDRHGPRPARRPGREPRPSRV